MGVGVGGNREEGRLPNLTKGRRIGNIWWGTLSDNFGNALQISENKIKDNLLKKERDSLSLLANDKNIVIKPSDKCGKIVAMDTGNYEKASLDILASTECYEELSYDPNDQYKQSIGKEIDQLRQMDYITDFQHSTLNEGGHTSLFYSLFKLRKVFTLFPSFRPICSGSKRLSERIDSFLKAAAQKLLSYIQDTT